MEQATNTISTVEAADILGLSVSTVRRRLKEGEIPSVIVGGDYRIPRDAVVPDTNNPVVHPDLAGLPAFIDVSKAAEILGMTPDAVRYHIRQQHIPVRRFGRRLRIPTVRLAAVVAGLE